ncbi:hypothetical protein CR513_17725, partial [Mucuna pruriens]
WIDGGGNEAVRQSYEELKQKLIATTLELETMRKVKRELLNLLKMAYKERDEAREEVQKLVKKLTAPNSMVMIPAATKANSSVTESNSPSHVSSPMESLVEAVSPSEFSNVVVESQNVGYLNQALVQSRNVSRKRTCDVENEVIEFLAKRKALPQKGKLLKAVTEAGPLLQTLLVAGPLPTWRNPPPLRTIKTPPLAVQDFGSNSLQKPMLQVQPSHSLLDVAVVNNALHLTPNATCKNLAPSGIQQRHQYLL